MDHMILDQRLDDLPTSVGQYKHDGIEVTPESGQKCWESRAPRSTRC